MNGWVTAELSPGIRYEQRFAFRSFILKTQFDLKRTNRVCKALPHVSKGTLQTSEDYINNCHFW